MTIEEFVKMKRATKGAITKATNCLKKLEEVREELLNEFHQKKTSLIEEYKVVLEVLPNFPIKAAFEAVSENGIPDETVLASTPAIDLDEPKTVTISDVAKHLNVSASAIRQYWTWDTNAPLNEVNEKLTEMGYPMM